MSSWKSKVQCWDIWNLLDIFQHLIIARINICWYVWGYHLNTQKINCDWPYITLCSVRQKRSNPRRSLMKTNKLRRNKKMKKEEKKKRKPGKVVGIEKRGGGRESVTEYKAPVPLHHSRMSLIRSIHQQHKVWSDSIQWFFYHSCYTLENITAPSKDDVSLSYLNNILWIQLHFLQTINMSTASRCISLIWSFRDRWLGGDKEESCK